MSQLNLTIVQNINLTNFFYLLSTAAYNKNTCYFHTEIYSNETNDLKQEKGSMKKIFGCKRIFLKTYKFPIGTYATNSLNTLK